MILQFVATDVTWDEAAAACMGLCTPPSSMCHLPRLYSEQQGIDLVDYGKEFHENLLMYELIWNIRFPNCVFSSFRGINKDCTHKRS